MITDTNKFGKILIIDDNNSVLKAAKLFLKRHFLEVDTYLKPEEIPRLITQKNYDLILLDMNFTKDVSSGNEGFYWLSKILEIDPSSVVILMTAYGDISTAIKAIKSGGSNFILKPWDNQEFLATIHSSIRIRESKLEINRLQKKYEDLNVELNDRYSEIIGNGPAMLKIFNLIDRVAITDANVLILGENGTGKELVARAIHRNSKRSRQAFVNVDMGSIAESLFESELFGHKKGAFTDAKEDRTGRFEAAHNGTLFLDEITNLSLPLQVKLLKVLENRKVMKVGAQTEIPVNIRLVCATNVDPYAMTEAGEFRQDLLYRINTIEISLPALRDRLEDIPLLVDHFFAIYAKKYGNRVKKVSPEVIPYFQKYQWPGNIRELRHAIERAVIISDNEILQPYDFDLRISEMELKTASKNTLDGAGSNIKQVESSLIETVLLKHNGNIAKTAIELGLTRQSLYRRLKKYGLE
jgi:DNA-binding NtrC family response regulator